MAEPTADVPSADGHIAWRAFLRASDEGAVAKLVARLATAAGVDLEVIAAERYWKDSALFVAELRHREDQLPVPICCGRSFNACSRSALRGRSWLAMATSS